MTEGKIPNKSAEGRARLRTRKVVRRFPLDPTPKAKDKKKRER